MSQLDPQVVQFLKDAGYSESQVKDALTRNNNDATMALDYLTALQSQTFHPDPQPQNLSPDVDELIDYSGNDNALNSTEWRLPTYPRQRTTTSPYDHHHIPFHPRFKLKPNLTKNSISKLTSIPDPENVQLVMDHDKTLVKNFKQAEVENAFSICSNNLSDTLSLLNQVQKIKSKTNIF